jgi:hypothetical protein
VISGPQQLLQSVLLLWTQGQRNDQGQSFGFPCLAGQVIFRDAGQGLKWRQLYQARTFAGFNPPLHTQQTITKTLLQISDA